MVAAGLLLGAASCAPTETERPNILVILADDLGMHDVGAYGNGDVITPNIDRLAEAGFRFTRFYTAGDTCSPTRASLSTGMYPQRLGYGHYRRPALPAKVVTLPELMRSAGYTTHHIGKWHLGHERRQDLPLAQGNGSFFGFLHGRLLKFPSPGAPGIPTYLNPLLRDGDREPRPTTGHLTDLLTDRAIDTIRESQGTRPWFMNLWYFAPHGPIQPADRWIERYPSTPQGRYHALVSTLDEGIGRVLKALEDTRQLDRTVILFLSDNGPTATSAPSNHPFFGTKGEFFEGSVRVPLIVWRPAEAGGSVVQTIVSSNDVYPTIAALAGVEVDHAVDGQDLTPLLGHPSGAIGERPLFWEAREFAPRWGGSPDPLRPSPESLAPGLDFSVLTADGRWRLTKERGGLALFDLVEDPTGHVNVIAGFPARVDELIAQYQTWSREM